MRGAWVQAPSIPSESTCGSFVSGLLRPSPAEAGYGRAFHPGRPGAPPSGCRERICARGRSSPSHFGVKLRLVGGQLGVSGQLGLDRAHLAGQAGRVEVCHVPEDVEVDTEVTV